MTADPSAPPQGFGLTEDKVRIVFGRDSRPSGEAYCIFEGPGVDVRGALGKVLTPAQPLCITDLFIGPAPRRARLSRRLVPHVSRCLQAVESLTADARAVMAGCSTA